MRSANVPEGSDEIRALYVWLDERLVQLANNNNEAHRRLREDIQALNGSVRDCTKVIAEHDSTIAVLNDRSNRAERQGGILGAITGGLSAGIVLAIKSLLGK